MKHEETYTSTLHTHVHFFIYEPQVIIRVKAVLFVQHDLNENASNYDHFANFMCDKGYVVVVSDMVGHGRSLIDFEQGYFGKTDVLDHFDEGYASSTESDDGTLYRYTLLLYRYRTRCTDDS